MVVLKKSNSLDNRCHFCRKVFCCSECRDEHEDKKHPEINSSKPKCPLCFKFDLLYDPRLNSKEQHDFDRAQLVCHVVINHLPLRCKICGQKFESNQAFQSAEPCKGPIKKPPPPPLVTPLASTPQIVFPPRIDTTVNSKCEEEVFVTPASELKLPLTPKYQIEVSAPNSKSLGSADLKHPENFDSPPELARHTSTPMHFSVVSLQKQNTFPPSLPEFNLKTPTWQRTFDSTTGSSTCGSAVSVSSESRYYTAEVDERMLRLSLEGSNNSVNTRANQGTPTWSSPVYPILKKQLKKQNSDDDSPTTGTSYRVERSILKSALLSRIDDSSHRDSIEKRVRFSDQFEPPTASNTTTNTTMADTSTCEDIFFEARDTLDDEASEEVKDNNSLAVREMKDEKKKAETLVDNGESKVDSSSVSSTTNSSSSSRVVMMLLVEKTVDNAKGFSSLDLAPFIDSGLKKLEETAASADNSKSDNGNSSGTIAKATTQVTSYTREIDGSLTETSKGCRRRASIKDTYVSRTDRIECITPPPRRRGSQDSTEDQDRELACKADSLVGLSSHNKTDGLFSAVARVVRSALKKLPAAVTARNLSREPIPSPNSNSLLDHVAVDQSHAVTAAAAATTTIVRSSSIKRPRERIDSHDEVATLRDSPASINNASSFSSVGGIASSTRITSTATTSNELVVTSPAAKRHRGGWYRIRAREPIARMRNEQRQVVAVSPRGASRETQRFQQGTLSIGDTFLPLPSRAHQSTQTDDQTS